jgi:hypothetical protein
MASEDLLHLIRMTEDERDEETDVLREARDALLTQANRISPKSQWRDVVLGWARRLGSADRLASVSARSRSRRLGVAGEDF